MATSDKMAQALALCHKLGVEPESAVVTALSVRLSFAHESLSRVQRQALKRHFGRFTKSAYSGDIFSDVPDTDGISATIGGAYECRTVCVASKSGAEDFDSPAETIAPLS